jgi:acylphosphatase
MADIYSLELVITGKRIQKSGFRSAIENVALDIDITGTAENIKEEDETGKIQYKVKVIGEGDEEQLHELIRRINKINTFHQINKIDVDIINSKKAISKRTYPEFIIKRDPSTEMSERMDEAVYYVKDLYNEMHSLKDDTNNNFKTMERKYHTISENLNLFVDIVAEYAKIKEPALAGKVDDLKKKYNR